MRSLPLDEKILLFIVAILVAALGAAFSYVVLDPRIGFDDANITQIYARHIADGHGYVYNIGGERVEGSTSLLWTLINAAAFKVSDSPAPILAMISMLLTTLTLFFTGRSTQMLVGTDAPLAAFAAVAAFLIFPGFFGWMVWSLMDMTLWIFLVTTLFLVLVWRNTGDASGSLPWVLLCVVALLLPITRPEGIVLTTGLALIYLLRSAIMRDDSWPVGLAIGLSGAISAVCATLWRLSYFGYPAPNTFYAKTSSDFVPQTISGLRYILSYFEVGHNVLLIGFLCVAAVVIVLHGTRAASEMVLVICLTILGAVFIYTLLGGDHFGSHRFLLFVIPLGLPIIMCGFALITTTDGMLSRPMRVFAVGLLALPFVIIAATSMRNFAQDQGNIGNEFAIAEDGVRRGAILATLPSDPVVGVVTAGGVGMGYGGPIQDLMGLNWTVMAHAPPDDITADIPNHTGFNQNVFWDQPPDIFVARTVSCPDMWMPLDGFLDTVTDSVSRSQEFSDFYDMACYQGLVFHVAKTYVESLSAAGEDLPFDLLPRVPAS